MRTIFVLTCFLAIAFVGCKNDPCEGVVCQNNGVAVESGDDCFCDCTSGFTGVFCEVDVCEGVDCQNGGTLIKSGDDCFCDCTAFYTGDRCNIPINEHYTGTYDGNTECDGALPEQTSHLLTKESGSINLMNVSNFGMIEFTNRTTFNVPTQEYLGTPYYYNMSVSGSGTLENNVLTINYTLFMQGTQTQQVDCQFVGTRPY